MSDFDAIDRIYQEVDALLIADSFSRVDEMLDAVDVTAIGTGPALAYATITFAARERLRARVPYVARLREHLTKTRPGDVGALLAGLEAE